MFLAIYLDVNLKCDLPECPSDLALLALFPRSVGPCVGRDCNIILRYFSNDNEHLEADEKGREIESGSSGL